MHYVVDASYLGAYKLKIQFENDEVRIVDLSDHLDGPIFEPLGDISFFRQVKVDHDIDTVVWPNGADFSPDFLYDIGINAGDVLQPADTPEPRARLSH